MVVQDIIAVVDCGACDVVSWLPRTQKETERPTQAERKTRQTQKGQTYTDKYPHRKVEGDAETQRH
eukprot:13081110-Alexandrium_andersonii.AAC.1